MAITSMWNADCGMRSSVGNRKSPFPIPHSPFRGGQSAIEYAVLIAATVAALVGMSVYTKRALSGRWRQVGDTFGFGRQYEHCVTLINGAKESGC